MVLSNSLFSVYWPRAIEGKPFSAFFKLGSGVLPVRVVPAIGVLLFVYYHDTGLLLLKSLDRAYPEFVWNHLPVGLSGLVIAAILAAAMSNLSAGFKRAFVNNDHGLLASDAAPDVRCSPITARALVHGGLGPHSFLSRFGGAALGKCVSKPACLSRLYSMEVCLVFFCWAFLTKKPGEWAAIVGMSAGFIATLLLRTQVAYTWYVLIGSVTTFVVGYVASFVVPNPLPATNRE